MAKEKPIRVTVGRNGKYWQFTWYDPRTGQRRRRGMGHLSDATMAEMLTKAAEIERNLYMGGDPRTGELNTLAKACDDFLAFNTEFAAGTVDLYERTFHIAKSYFGGDTLMPRMDVGLLREFEREFKAGRMYKHYPHPERIRDKPGLTTIYNHMRRVRNVFYAEWMAGRLPVDPFRKLRLRMPDPEEVYYYLDLDNFERVLTKCRCYAEKLLLGLGRLAGLRQSEACSLQWSDIDWQAKRLMVQNPGKYKGRKKRSRVVPIEPRLYSLLLEAFEHAGADPVLLSGINHTAGNLRRRFQSVCKLANMELWPRWCHMLRKNCEADWVGRGLPLHVVALWLGHRPEVALNNYLTVVQDNHWDTVTAPAVPPAAPAGGEQQAEQALEVDLETHGRYYALMRSRNGGGRGKKGY